MKLSISRRSLSYTLRPASRPVAGRKLDRRVRDYDWSAML